METYSSLKCSASWRYDGRGSVVRQYESEQWSFFTLALDLDPRFVWTGGVEGLRRLELESGEVVEQRATFGVPMRISVVGEPRASSATSVRRRTVAPGGGSRRTAGTTQQGSASTF